MQLHDATGKRLYLTPDEREAFVAAANQADRPVRTLCLLHATGCRISEALALTPAQIDIKGKAVVFESLKKRRKGIYRAVPVPPALLSIPSTWCTASGRPENARTGHPLRSGRGRA